MFPLPPIAIPQIAEIQASSSLREGWQRLFMRDIGVTWGTLCTLFISTQTSQATA